MKSAYCVIGAAMVWLLTMHADAHPSAFTIEQVMGAAYPSALTAASRGDAVAWVFEDKGRSNIWIANPIQNVPAHPITVFQLDNGYHIAQLSWSADEQTLAFTRGQSLEDQRPANVDSSANGPMPREVWVAPISGGSAREIAPGHGPRFAPDGADLAYVDQQTIWLIDVASKASPQPIVVDMGQVGSLVWSSDGKRLAFVSERGHHSLIGVYDLAAKSITWMSPSLDHDVAPVFSPDGSRIAFIRIPSEDTPPFISHRRGHPWSLWVVDAQTGKGRAAWSADPGDGSVFAPTLSEQNLLWASGDRLIFPWEKTGWLQLYAVPSTGGTATALTSGPFEIDNFVIGTNGRRLIYSSNENDLDRRHVWICGLDGAQPHAIARDQNIEDFPQTSGDGAIYALRSGATEPLQPVILSQDKQWKPLARQTASDFPAGELVVPQSVTFFAKDGQRTHAQIFLPKDGLLSHPAILFFHGGPRRQMLLGFHPMGAYNWMYAMNQYFAAEGYIVLSVNYRGGIGYGLDYREAKNFGPGGGSEINDLLGAVRYLQSRRDVDPNRLGIWGASYGGLMTALGLARDSDAIKAGVDYAGVYDWATFLNSVGVPIADEAAKRLAVASSPIATINAWHSPVLVAQADDDRSVPSLQSTQLIQALRARHVPHDTLVIPNEIHDLARYVSWIDLFKAADAYFAAKLGAPGKK